MMKGTYWGVAILAALGIGGYFFRDDIQDLLNKWKAKDSGDDGNVDQASLNPNSNSTNSNGSSSSSNTSTSPTYRVGTPTAKADATFQTLKNGTVWYIDPNRKFSEGGKGEIIALQKILNVSASQKLAEDGILGPATLNELDRQFPVTMLDIVGQVQKETLAGLSILADRIWSAGRWDAAFRAASIQLIS